MNDADYYYDILSKDKEKPTGKLKEEPIKKLEVISVNEYINAIEAINKYLGSKVLFRGLSDENKKVTSSAYRKLEKLEKLISEQPIWRHFKDYHSKLINNALHLKDIEISKHKDSVIDMLAHLQHIGAKTCLIDYTKNPLVALWFACKYNENKDTKNPTNGAVFAIKSSLNLSRIDEKFELGSLFNKDLDAICIFDPPYINRRVISQQSTFLFNPMGKIDEYRHIKIVIEQDYKDKIVKQLKQIGIHKKALFPDIIGSVEWFEYEGSDEEKYYDLIEKAAKSYRGFDYQTAIKYFKRALKIEMKSEMEGATILNNIGRAYYKKGEYDEAVNEYNKALEIRERILGNHPDTATTYNNRGTAYNKKGEYDKAFKDYIKALWIRVKVLGKESLDTATTYNHIGLAYNGQGKYDRALKYYKKAQTIREKALGNEHQNTANTYNNRGETHYYKREYKEASDWHEKALKIQEIVLGDHPDTAKTYNDIGMVHAKNGKHGEASDCYNKALKIREQILGKKHPDTAMTYNNIGTIHYKKGEYDKAFELYEKARDIAVSKLSENHSFIREVKENVKKAKKKLKKK